MAHRIGDPVLLRFYVSFSVLRSYSHIHEYESEAESVSFDRVARDSYSCNTYEWSVHVNLYESELTRKLLVETRIRIIF